MNLFRLACNANVVKRKKGRTSEGAIQRDESCDARGCHPQVAYTRRLETNRWQQGFVREQLLPCCKPNQSRTIKVRGCGAR